MNKYIPHLLVLPEDDANRQIANGFLLNPNLKNRSIQVLPPAGGWTKVLEDFSSVHVSEMQTYSQRRIVLVIDFERHEDRLSLVREKIPQALADRVFVLGTMSEPENLKIAFGESFEEIGKALAKDCAYNTNELWGHDLLSHNAPEINRMIISVKPFLFN